MDTYLPLNQHGADRLARIVLGLGLVVLAIAAPGSHWALVGLLPLLTGIVGSCPIYGVLGFSTWKPSESPGRTLAPRQARTSDAPKWWEYEPQESLQVVRTPVMRRSRY